jgi:hypothetical protein
MTSLHIDPCYSGDGFFEVSPTTHWLVELISTCKMVMNFNHLGYWLSILQKIIVKILLLIVCINNLANEF